MSMGPGGMGPSGGHGPSNLNDNMAPGLPSTSLMQSQMSNGESSSQMCILQINPGPWEHYFPCKPRFRVHTAPSCRPSSVLSVCLTLRLLHGCLWTQHHVLSITITLFSTALLPASVWGVMTFAFFLFPNFTHITDPRQSILVQPRKLPVKMNWMWVYD